MLSISTLRPELEIPGEAWGALAKKDFINFAVPLLNPPDETDGRISWSGHDLLLVADNLAAFARDEDASQYMPYGEMYKIVANEDETIFAQIYAIFFEKLGGEWQMMYRLMNCDRVLGEWLEPERESSVDAAGEALPSNWMLTLSDMDDWLTLDAYLNYYCKFESYNKSYVGANIREQLRYMEGEIYNEDDVRITAMPGGTVVIVPKLTKGSALVLDVVNNTRLAHFIMDDPPPLIERFWRLHSKIFLSAADRIEKDAMICDARHFLYAIKSAREQRLVEEQVTAAAFYC